MDAIIRVELGIDPDTLSDEDWAKKFQEWLFVQRIKNKTQEALIEKSVKKVLVEVVNGVFKSLNSKKKGSK